MNSIRGWRVGGQRGAFVLAISLGSIGQAHAAGPEEWVRVVEDERSIKIETDLLEAVIPMKNPKHWMTGIEKGSFLDKKTGFREVGDGLWSSTG